MAVACAFSVATMIIIESTIIRSTTAVLAMLNVKLVSGAHKDIIHNMAANEPDAIPINCPNLKKIFI